MGTAKIKEENIFDADKIVEDERYRKIIRLDYFYIKLLWHNIMIRGWKILETQFQGCRNCGDCGNRGNYGNYRNHGNSAEIIKKCCGKYHFRIGKS